MTRLYRRHHPLENAEPLRAHFDGSYHPGEDRMTYAVCVYDANGNIILRRLGAEQGGSSTEAEVRAALAAICAVRELSNGRPTKGWLLVGDHRTLMRFLASDHSQPRAKWMRPWVAECRRLLAGGIPVWVGRDRNYAADWTASQRLLAEDGIFVDLPLRALEEKAVRREKRLAQWWQEHVDGTAKPKRNRRRKEKRPYREHIVSVGHKRDRRRR